MTDLQRITRASRRLSWLCLALLIALPLYLSHHWLLPPESWIDGMPFGGRGIDLAQWAPGLDTRLLGMGITALPGLCIGLVLLRLYRLFGNYARGELFSENNVLLHRQVANAALAFVVAWIISESALSVVLSWHSETRHLTLSFTHAHATALFAAVVFRLITGIMAVGQRLEAENRAFV